MSRGCCLGCAGVTALALLILGATFYLLDQAFSIFSPAPRVALDRLYGAEYPVVARLDLSSEYLRDVTGRSIGAQPWFVDLLWPHEAYFFIDINEERTRHDLTLAISTRRLGSLVALGFPFEENVPLGGGYDITNVGLDDRGVLSILAGGPIGDETLAATENWSAVVEPYTLNREHLLELVIDNSAGDGYLALRRLFDAESLPETAEAASVDETQSPEDPLATDEPAPTTPATETDAPELTETEIDELFRLIGALRLRMDIHENRALRAVLETRYATESDAESAFPLLQRWLDTWKEDATGHNASVEGELARNGTEITGEFILTDVDTAVVEESQERIREIEQTQ